MILQDLITEGVGGVLYHGTSLKGAESILEENKIHATQRARYLDDSPIVSFSRSLNQSVMFSSKKMDTVTKNRGVIAVVFAIDIDLLRMDLGKRVFSYHDTPHISKLRVHEQEQSVRGDIENFSLYIETIYIFADDNLLDNVIWLARDFPLVLSHPLSGVLEYRPNLLPFTVKRTPLVHPTKLVDSECLTEGWLDRVATGALAVALGFGAANYAQRGSDQTPLPPSVSNTPVTQPITRTEPPPSQPKQVIEPNDIERLRKLPENKRMMELAEYAYGEGIRGIELAQFLAQTHHESLGFRRMVEMGSRDRHMRRYDPQYSPRRAKILGNTKPGDGLRFIGRGDIQLTGRYNYTVAARALGIPLDTNPELAADPENAKKITVWYWKWRVQPQVKDFANTAAATKPINSSLNGLAQRKELFEKYRNALGV